MELHDLVDEATAGVTNLGLQEMVDTYEQHMLPSQRRSKTMSDDQVSVQEAVKECTKRWWNLYQGGNMWAGWLCLNAFARDVCGFKHKSHKDYECWETLAKISGFRFIHEDFALVCEKPIKLETYVNERGEHVAHCEDGPSHLWADGFSIHHLDGVKVPGWIVEHPEEITVEKIHEEVNQEVQLIMRQRYGEERYLADIGAKVIDLDSTPCELYRSDSKVIYRALMEDKDGRRFLVAGDGSTKDRTFVMMVPNETETCVEAERALTSLDPKKQFARS